MRMIITLLFLSFTLLSQAQRPGGHNHHDHHDHHYDVPVPMSSIEFNQAMGQMNRESFDDGKMRIAKGIINGNYLLSQQVKVLVEEFSFKENQEKLAEYAYPKTYDQNKYYMVYSAFTFDSSKDKVSKWVSTQPINDYQGSSYYGPSPISDADFAQGLNHLRSESFDSGKMRMAKQLIDGNYIYADQVAVLVKEFDFKGNEEEIAKYAYPKTYDQKNYYLLYDAFTFDSSKDELERWLDSQPIKDYARPPNNNHNHGGGHHGSNHGNNHGGGYNNSNHGNNQGNNHGGGYNNSNPNNNNNNDDDRPTVNITIGKNPNNNTTNNNQGPNVQAMSARDFDTMKARITDFSSDNDRISKAKEYLPNNFLLAEQIKEIMRLFVFEDVRLDFAKASYAKTYDPQNYSVVKSVLVNPSSKQDLQAYMDNY